MFDLTEIEILILDVVDRNKSHAEQEAQADFILNALKRNYQVFLFSSRSDDVLSEEKIKTPGLKWMAEKFPFQNTLTKSHPQILSSKAIWVSEDPEIQSWVHSQDVILAATTLKGEILNEQKTVRLRTWNDLLGLIDPSNKVLKTVAGDILDRWENLDSASFLVGISGPPLSGYLEFGLSLAQHLEALGAPLVEWLDLSDLIVGLEEIQTKTKKPDFWKNPKTGSWILDHIILPVKRGERVSIDEKSPDVPDEINHLLPLYYSEESIVLVMGEMLFNPPLNEYFQFNCHMEVSDKEISRRLFEIPQGEHFEEKFTQQYQSKFGVFYQQYLDENRISSRVTARISMEKPGIFGPLILTV